MKIFFHSADLDGYCSGALVKYFYQECEMIGINYGDEFPWDSIKRNEVVFMVDFSLQPFELMVKLAKKCKLIWIDHHKSAIEDAKNHPDFDLTPHTLQDGIGACRLVWDRIRPKSNTNCTPTFIKLLSEYDVWNHSDPRTLPFQYGMRLEKDTHPNNQEFWASLFDYEKVMQIVERGGVILEYQMLENKKYAKTCYFETEIDGLKCLAINKMLSNSQLFDSVWDETKYDAMLMFGYRKGQWHVSLYSTKEDVDVSVVAKKYGGGGHRGASGFQCAYPFFIPNYQGGT